MITKLFFSLLLFSLFLSSMIIYAQENYANETEVNIPQLDKFHEVMFPIWHKAFSDKDYNSLRSYSNKVQNLASDIYKVILPGILRDKKDQWQEGIKNFKVAVENYTKYSSTKDDEKLLNAAEELHTNYEKLVRIIHPVTPEINEFHKVLYVIYHYYLPEKEYSKIKSVSGNFLKKAQLVKEAKLPEKFKDITEKYNLLTAELFDAVNNLNELCMLNRDDELKVSVNKVHLKYQKLESLFE